MKPKRFHMFGVSESQERKTVLWCSSFSGIPKNLDISQKGRESIKIYVIVMFTRWN